MTLEVFELYADGVQGTLASPEALDAVTELAMQIEADAVLGSPIGVTGRAADSLETIPATVVDGVATAIVYSDDPFWHLIEYGSVNNDPYRPITRAAEDNATFDDVGN